MKWETEERFISGELTIGATGWSGMKVCGAVSSK